MRHNIKKLFQSSNLPLKQRGAVLMLMAFILGLGVAAYAIRTFNTASLQSQQDQKTLQTLGAAKRALMSWAVNHRYNPGQMPWPDRNGDGDYDGSSDCSTAAFQYSVLLGQLPGLPTTSPCLDPNTGSGVYAGLSTYPGLGEKFKDAQGNSLWYAVSRNLVRSYSPAADPVINPGIVNAPTYQWLQVLDRNGNLISDRVAAVLIAPGAPIGGQDRSGGIADASEFLDSFQIGVATYSNRGYATDDEDFVVGDDSNNVSANDVTFVQPYYFNDKLVYITIDELMAALEKRVGEQVRATLKTYQDTNGYYPYAAQLGTTTNYTGEDQNASATGPLTSGFLPVDYQSCSYSRTSTFADSTFLICNKSIFDAATSGVTQVRFTRVGGSAFTASTGSCSFTSNNCNCTGTGNCSNGAGSLAVFCTATSCSSTSNVGSGALGTYRVTGGKFTSRSGGCAQTSYASKAASCTNNDSVITCSASNGSLATTADVSFDTALSAWFETNGWQSYVYYHMTRPAAATMTVGSKSTEAVVVTAGRPIIASPFASKGSAQAQPSCTALDNYLDSVENADGGPAYDAASTPRSASYNDQNFIVEP